MEIARQAVTLSPPARSSGRSGGFSLVELLLVLVILGVLAVVVGPRLPNITGFQMRGFHDELISAMRYGQKLAVAGGCPVQVQVGGDAYALFQGDTDCDDATLSRPVQHPSTRDPFSGSAPEGVSLTPAATFVFNALGDINGGGSVNLIVSGGGTSRTITIHGGTGYVEEQP